MDNNNKPRNVLKREEYEILALKKKSINQYFQHYVEFSTFLYKSISVQMKTTFLNIQNFCCVECNFLW